MVLIDFLGPIDKESVELDIKSLKELSIYMKKDDILKDWIDNCAIAVNDTIIKDKDYELKSGDRVSILPPVCGG